MGSDATTITTLDSTGRVVLPAEVFSTLTGGAQGLRVGADLAQQLLRESVLPCVNTVTLAELPACQVAQQVDRRGQRGE